MSLVLVEKSQAVTDEELAPFLSNLRQIVADEFNADEIEVKVEEIKLLDQNIRNVNVTVLIEQRPKRLLALDGKSDNERIV